MSVIAYSAAVALIGASAAVTSQVVIAIDAPVEKRVEITAPANVASSYDFSKFTSELVSPVEQAEHLKPVEIAAVGKSQLQIIVRDNALAKKADSLAAEADATAADKEIGVITGEEVEAPQFDSAALVPLPKTRPSLAPRNDALSSRWSLRRNAVRQNREVRRPVRVAEASTSPRKRLARRLRSKGWLIGAFR